MLLNDVYDRTSDGIVRGSFCIFGHPTDIFPQNDDSFMAL